MDPRNAGGDGPEGSTRVRSRLGIPALQLADASREKYDEHPLAARFQFFSNGRAREDPEAQWCRAESHCPQARRQTAEEFPAGDGVLG